MISFDSPPGGHETMRVEAQHLGCCLVFLSAGIPPSYPALSFVQEDR